MAAQLLNLRDYKAIFFTMLLPNAFIIAMPFLMFTETYSRCLDIRVKRTAPATSAHSEKKGFLPLGRSLLLLCFFIIVRQFARCKEAEQLIESGFQVNNCFTWEPEGLDCLDLHLQRNSYLHFSVGPKHFYNEQIHSEKIYISVLKYASRGNHVFVHLCCFLMCCHKLWYNTSRDPSIQRLFSFSSIYKGFFKHTTVMLKQAHSNMHWCI